MASRQSNAGTRRVNAEPLCYCVRTFLNKWCFEQGCYHGQLCTMALQRNLWSGCIFIRWKLLPWREGGREREVCVLWGWRELEEGKKPLASLASEVGQTAVILQCDQKQMFWNRRMTTLEININSEMLAATDKSKIKYNAKKVEIHSYKCIVTTHTNVYLAEQRQWLDLCLPWYRYWKHLYP